MKLFETELILIEAEIRRFRQFFFFLFLPFGALIFHFSYVSLFVMVEWEPIFTFICAADLFIESNIYWHMNFNGYRRWSNFISVSLGRKRTKRKKKNRTILMRNGRLCGILWICQEREPKKIMLTIDAKQMCTSSGPMMWINRVRADNQCSAIRNDEIN